MSAHIERLADVSVILRWSHGAIGLTGWGVFWLLMLIIAVGSRK